MVEIMGYFFFGGLIALCVFIIAYCLSILVRPVVEYVHRWYITFKELISRGS